MTFVVSRNELRHMINEAYLWRVVELALKESRPALPLEVGSARPLTLPPHTVLMSVASDTYNERARAAGGLWAAGADVGGVSTGGWSSALAAALVLGRVAAEDAVG